MHTLEPTTTPARTGQPALLQRRSDASRAGLCAAGWSSVADARFELGSANAAFRQFPAQRAIALAPSDSLVHVIVPLRGSVVAVTADDTYEAGEGGALLLGRAERASCVWQGGSVGLFLNIPRSVIQAAASQLFDEPRRLASFVSAFDWRDRPIWTVKPSAHLAASHRSDEAGHELQSALCVSLVRALEMAGLARAAFPVAKSVLRALEHVRRHPQEPWAVEDLSPIAGVTAATLRKNFRSCLGLTITQVVRDARLDWVRDRLGSCNESRSVGQLAQAAGFGTAAMLARAYQQRFAETPTQTRTNAFRQVRE